MREFGPYISPETEAQIRQAAQALFDAVPEKRAAYGRDFAMDGREDEVVFNEADLKIGEFERYRLAVTLPAARPPFEWLMEITADIGESDYIKHYLIRDEDIVFAQRKLLIPIDEAEAKVILADLATAQASLEV
jgi:hypothetical protein